MYTAIGICHARYVDCLLVVASCVHSGETPGDGQ